ncbi:MAG: hypothetical protein J6N76_04115 [Lachnospiraceae bacterium]|nr:hypothetical protein [Lachnospiraceae bacterium]
MFRLFYSRSGHYRRIFLCLFFVLVLTLSAACDSSEHDRAEYVGLGHSSSIETGENDLSDFITNEFSGYSLVKYISAKNPVTGKLSGSRTASSYTVISLLLMLICAFALCNIYFSRPVLTSRHFIISYIHDLDGMKP